MSQRFFAIDASDFGVHGTFSFEEMKSYYVLFDMWYLMLHKSQHKHELHKIELRRCLENIPAQFEIQGYSDVDPT